MACFPSISKYDVSKHGQKIITSHSGKLKILHKLLKANFPQTPIAAHCINKRNQNRLTRKGFFVRNWQNCVKHYFLNSYLDVVIFVF